MTIFGLFWAFFEPQSCILEGLLPPHSIVCVTIKLDTGVDGLLKSHHG
jgi:hypothetical protein